MKLKVPFYHQTTNLNCGPAALRMVVAYFDKDTGVDILEERTGIKEGKGTASIQIATAAAISGYKTDFYSKHVYFNEENLKHDFYKRYTDLAHQSKELVYEAKKAGVRIREETVTLDELLRDVGKNSVPIVLLDWNIVTEERDKGYHGHFVPVVGYDEENVYIHNHGFKKPMAFMPIKKKIFDEARRADGTDEDIVVVYRK